MEQMLLKVMRWKLCEFNVEISDEKRDGEGNREGQEGGGSDLSSSYSWESNILLLLAAPGADMCVRTFWHLRPHGNIPHSGGLMLSLYLGCCNAK